MKKLTTFLILVLLVFFANAQVNVQDDVNSLKKQVNSLKYDYAKFKKQLIESAINQNAKIASVEKNLLSTDTLLKSQTIITGQNTAALSEIKKDTSSKIYFLKSLVWICLILVLVLTVFVIYSFMLLKKNEKLSYNLYHDLRNRLDKQFAEMKASIDSGIAETSRMLEKKMESSKSEMESAMAANFKSTGNSISELNVFVQEAQKSQVEQIDNVKAGMDSLKSSLESTFRKDISGLRTENEKMSASVKEEMAKLEKQNKELGSNFQAEIKKIQAETNKMNASLKEEMTKLKAEKLKNNSSKKEKPE